MSLVEVDLISDFRIKIHFKLNENVFFNFSRLLSVSLVKKAKNIGKLRLFNFNFLNNRIKCQKIKRMDPIWIKTKV